MTTQTIKDYCSAVQKGQLNPHVVLNGKGWIVKFLYSKEPSHHFETKDEAIDYARQIARERDVEFFVHSADGRIEQRMK